MSSVHQTLISIYSIPVRSTFIMHCAASCSGSIFFGWPCSHRLVSGFGAYVTCSKELISSGMGFLLHFRYDRCSPTAECLRFGPVPGDHRSNYSDVFSSPDVNSCECQPMFSWRTSMCWGLTLNGSLGAELRNQLSRLHHGPFPPRIILLATKPTTVRCLHVLYHNRLHQHHVGDV